MDLTRNQHIKTCIYITYNMMYGLIGRSNRKGWIPLVPCVSIHPLLDLADFGQIPNIAVGEKVFEIKMSRLHRLDILNPPLWLEVRTSTFGDHRIVQSFYLKLLRCLFPYKKEAPWAPRVACGCQRGNWQLALVRLLPGKIGSTGVGQT